MKNNNKKKISFELDTERIISIAELSEVYENICLNDVNIPLMLSGSNGIYIFLPFDNNELLKKSILFIKTKYSLLQCETFFFVLNGTDYYLVDKYSDELIELNDIYTSFKNIYLNTQRPYIDYSKLNLKEYEQLLKSEEELMDLVEDKEVEDTGDASFVKSLVPKMIINKIAKINDSLQDNSTYIDENTREDEDGIVYVRKYDETKLFGFIKEKRWFRCSDEDADKIYLLTFLGGWFGLHKFREGKIIKGLLYALTCGGYGVFYILDLIEMILGSKKYEEITYEELNGRLERHKEKVYYQKLRKKRLAIALVPVAFLITYLLLNTLYKGVYELIVNLLLSISDKNKINIVEKIIG